MQIIIIIYNQYINDTIFELNLNTAIASLSILWKKTKIGKFQFSGLVHWTNFDATPELS